MAPSAAHLHKLVIRNVKLIKSLWRKTSHLIQTRIPTADLQLIPVRVNARQPLHPLAYLRQSKGRWYTTHSAINATVRRFTTAADSAAPGLKYNRSLFPKSRTATAVNSLPGRAPFASTLRPNLTGGTLGRTAGGYSLGSGRIGGARYFSHTPTAPAQVLQNVSQAVRAFCVGGHKAQFAGNDPRTGEKRFRAVSALQDKTVRKVTTLPKATPGSYVEFSVNPTITALTPLNAVVGYSFSAEAAEARSEKTLNTSGLLDVLSVDFSRSLKDLAAVLNDLQRLATLGDLPITYHSSSLRVHFPGCDADSVERLCQELGVQRGFVQQDDDFDAFVGTEIALLFPFAPSGSASDADADDAFYDSQLFVEHTYVPASKHRDPIEWQQMLSPAYSQHSDDELSLHSDDSDFSPLEDLDGPEERTGNPWASEASSVRAYEQGSAVAATPLEYRDFEGIRRFIELCDGPRR